MKKLAINPSNKKYYSDDYIKGWENGVNAQYEATKDAVEVVRCKDCKYAHMTYGGECKYCDMWEEDGEALYLDEDFFCAYGERREGGEA